jgi:SAM-dependent methyltransferase
MTAEKRFQERYETGDTPWDIGKPDFNLIQTVTATPIKPCKALDIGCGTGDNTIWLAQQNFPVIGIDASEIAIDKAKDKALKANVQCTFMVIDFPTSRIEEAPFGFAFDRGCFHAVKSDKERNSFAKNVNAHLEKNRSALPEILLLLWSPFSKSFCSSQPISAPTAHRRRGPGLASCGKGVLHKCLAHYYSHT